MKTGIGIPCFFRLVTGLKCPGCGVTHMCVSLMRLDFASAWQSNAALLCLLPPGILVAGVMLVRYIRYGTKKPPKWCSALMIVMIAVLLIFGAARNLPGINL